MKVCSVKGCDNKHDAKGFCSKHYRQVKKHGSVVENTLADFNLYNDKGSYLEIILTDKNLNEIARAKIDKEDLPKLKAVGRWSLHSAGYVVNSYTDVYLHRLVTSATSTDYVDHKKNSVKGKLDNRKKNLRICSNSENNWNKDKPKSNTSGYKGVFWDNTHNVWKARIQINGKSKNLGSFKSAKEASKAYNKAAKSLHGKFFFKRS